MASINLRLFDADRQPLAGLVDVKVLDARGDVVADLRDRKASSTIVLKDLAPNERYQVRVFPVRHRAVGQLIVPGHGPARNVHIFCPVDSDRAQPRFPPFAELPTALTDVLARSTLEDTVPGAGTAGALGAEGLFASLTDIQRAGLLNLFRKMSATPVGLGAAWNFVHDVYRVRGDRIFANVTVGFRDHVKTEVTVGRFREVSGSMHDPGVGFSHAGSFKTFEPFGNLQLTFFVSLDAPLRFRVDADIDDAAGLAHVFQVVRNSVRDTQTHPYDIHQVLTFHHQLRPPYDLLV